MRNRIAITVTAAVLLSVAAQTPAHAYWDDVHYYLTYYIARVVGYTPEQAYRAAAADLSADYCEATEPTQMSAGDYLMGAREDSPGKQRPRWMFHSFRDETRFPGAIGNDPKGGDADKAISEQLDALWKAATSESNVNPGVYLHFVQDLGPHWGFGSAHGHYYDPADPVGSTKAAVLSGLQLGGTVDWLGSRTPAPYKDVEVMTATSLGEFLSLMSPRQQIRPDWAAGKVTQLIERLWTVNDFPDGLRPDELSLYTAFVKSRQGFGTMPTLTPEQQAKFAMHSDGPNLNAAALEVAAAMKTAGMMEERVKSHLEARQAFTFDANGNVTPGQLDQYVLTGSLKVNVEAREAHFAHVVIKAPPTYWNDKGHDLVRGSGNQQLPFSATYEQIPVGQVQVEVQSPIGDVLASQLVKIDKRRNEATLQIAPPGQKRPVWVLKPGYPQLGPAEALGAREVFGPRGQGEWDLQERAASVSAFTVHKRQEYDKTLVSDWVFTVNVAGTPPKVFREGDSFDLRVTGAAAGEKPEGDWHWTRHCYVSAAWSEWSDPSLPKNRQSHQCNLGVEPAPAPPSRSCQVAAHLVAPTYADLEDVREAGLYITVDQDVKLQYEWEYRLVTPQEAQQLLAGDTGQPGGTGSAGDQPTTPGTGAGAGPTRPVGPGGGPPPQAPGPDSPGATSEGLGMTVETRTGPDGKPMVVITKIGDDSPFVFGLEPGDVILAVDDVPIKSAGELGNALANKKAGDAVTVLIRRGAFEVAMTVLLEGP